MIKIKITIVSVGGHRYSPLWNARTRRPTRVIGLIQLTNVSKLELHQCRLEQLSNQIKSNQIKFIDAKGPVSH